jgi:hypothetical protein
VKRNQKIAACIVSVLGLAAAGAASAHMGPGMGGWGHMRGGAGPVSQLMTVEERTALREQMLNAKTPEERLAIAEANRAVIQQRAAEQGITLPACGGPGAGVGPGAGPGAGAGFFGAGVGPGAGFGPGAGRCFR